MRAFPETLLLGLAILLAWSPLVQAQSAEHKALASQLFEEAEALSRAGNYLEACPKYAESHRLDPQLGAMLHLARCYQQLGRLASAWALYKDALEVAELRHDDRAPATREQIQLLEPRLHRIRITLAQDSLAGLEVLRDGQPLGRAAWGTPIAVDPGRHEITVRAPRHQPWATQLTVQGQGGTYDVAVPPLQPLPTEATASSPGPDPPRPLDDERSASRSRAAALGWVVGGAGVLVGAAGGGLALGGQAAEKERDDVCPARVGCTRGDLRVQERLDEKARHLTQAGNVSLAVGGVALAAGAVIVIHHRLAQRRASRVSVHPWLVRSSGGVACSGSW